MCFTKTAMSYIHLTRRILTCSERKGSWRERGRGEEREGRGRDSLPKINSSSWGSSKTSMSLTTLGWSNFFKMAISLPMLSNGVLILFALAPGFGRTEWREENLGHRHLSRPGLNLTPTCLIGQTLCLIC